MGTYVLFPAVSDQPLKTTSALKLFVWAFMNGDRLVQEANFVRLPDRVQAGAFKVIASIRDKSGQSLGLPLLTPTLGQ